MDYRIVADSSCDAMGELKQQLRITKVPLSMSFGDTTYVDSDDMDIDAYVQAMILYEGKTTTACPSPGDYKNAFMGEGTAFGITLSGNLSGSYASAMEGKALAEQEGADVHVFDSKSASAGQTLIAIKIKELAEAGLDKLGIIEKINQYIKEMKTYFVLDSLENFIRNGRVPRLKGKLVSALNIKQILGSDGDGNIVLYHNCRGINQIVEKMASLVIKSGKNFAENNLVITHCRNLPLASAIRDAIVKSCPFKQIYMMQTRGLSSTYAYEKGVILSF